MAHYRVAGQSAKLEELLAQLRSKENENTNCQIMKQIQVRDRSQNKFVQEDSPIIARRVNTGVSSLLR